MQISFEQWGEARESLNIQIPWTIYHGLWVHRPQKAIWMSLLWIRLGFIYSHI